nr:hypothetical protein [Candidatus Njordarchaeota archaeon]
MKLQNSTVNMMLIAAIIVRLPSLSELSPTTVFQTSKIQSLLELDLKRDTKTIVNQLNIEGEREE